MDISEKSWKEAEVEYPTA